MRVTRDLLFFFLVAGCWLLFGQQQINFLGGLLQGAAVD